MESEVAALQVTIQGAESTDGAGCPKSYPYYCGPQRPTVGCAD